MIWIFTGINIDQNTFMFSKQFIARHIRALFCLTSLSHFLTYHWLCLLIDSNNGIHMPLEFLLQYFARTQHKSRHRYMIPGIYAPAVCKCASNKELRNQKHVTNHSVRSIYQSVKEERVLNTRYDTFAYRQTLFSSSFLLSDVISMVVGVMILKYIFLSLGYPVMKKAAGGKRTHNNNNNSEARKKRVCVLFLRYALK